MGSLVRKIAACFVASCTSSLAQQPLTAVIVKAGTKIVVASVATFDPKTAKVGDRLDFVVQLPIRSGYLTIVPRRTLLHGQVVATNPKVRVAIDPLTLEGTTVAFKGYPFEKRTAQMEKPPSELASHTHHSNGELAADVAFAPVIGAVGIAGAAVFLPLEVAIGAKNHPLGHHNSVLSTGTKSIIEIASDAFFNSELIPRPRAYTGAPVLYVVDRSGLDTQQVSCGTGNLPIGPPSYEVAMRFPPGNYRCYIAKGRHTEVSVDARQDSRYLIFRDKAGLHSVDLANRPDLLEWLPTGTKLQFFTDCVRLGAAIGGCSVASHN